MLHNFLPSIKKGINYCTNCGCLSYNNNPSQNIGCITNNLNIMKIDPLTIRYKPISLKIDFSLLSHKAYITYRQKGLSKINYLTSNYNLSNMIKYKSIGLMDQIYLNNKDIYIESIEIIATICILLCIEFNDCCSISEKNGLYSRNYNNNLQRKLNIKNDSYEINNKKNLYRHIKKEIKDIMYWQSFCLEKLDYNLGKYSAYDYLNLFFELGIVFNKENFDIINKYEFCLNFLEIIIKNYNICKYNQYVIALSIIYINFNNNKYFKEKIFKYIYGVDFSKKKYQLCMKEINSMIKDFYNIKLHINNNNTFFIKSQYINNCSNLYDNIYFSFNNKSNNYYYKNNNYNEKSNNNKNLISHSNITILRNSLIREFLLFQYIYLFEALKLNNNINLINNNINNFYDYLWHNLIRIKLFENNLNNFVNRKISSKIKNGKLENSIDH